MRNNDNTSNKKVYNSYFGFVQGKRNYSKLKKQIFNAFNKNLKYFYLFLITYCKQIINLVVYKKPIQVIELIPSR